MIFYILLVALLPLCRAALVNFTLDDASTSIVYLPADAWDTKQTCEDSSPTCVVRPDEAQLNGGTWHESTFSIASSNKHPNVPSTATASFNGSAVYVFCAIPRSTFAPNGNVQLTFYLDGIQAGQFSRSAAANNAQGIDYAVPVFALEDIPDAPHTLTIQNGLQNGADSLMILDSIVYTYDDGIPVSNSSPGGASNSNAGSSSLGSKGGLSPATVAVITVLLFGVMLLLGTLAVLLIRRRRKRRPVYAPYIPEGGVRAFPGLLEPSPAPSPRPSPASSRFVTSPGYNAPLAVSMPPPIYHGTSAQANWWTGRDRKTPAGIGTHRPYADLDPSSSNLQRPQGWERQPSL